MTPAQRFTTISQPAARSRPRLSHCFGLEALISLGVLAASAGFMLGWLLAGRLF